jgi:hypothetical protein
MQAENEASRNFFRQREDGSVNCVAQKKAFVCSNSIPPPDSIVVLSVSKRKGRSGLRCQFTADRRAVLRLMHALTGAVAFGSPLVATQHAFGNGTRMREQIHDNMPSGIPLQYLWA